MKPLVSQIVFRFALVISISTLVGCVSYGPAITGGELPFVPISSLDTVPTASVGGYGILAWPITYDAQNTNRLVGLGGYRTRGVPISPQGSNGWSFVYGAMAYTGQYTLNADSTDIEYRYTGGMLHGATRWHWLIGQNFDFVLEPSLSIFYEGGNYLHFRRQSILEGADYQANPLSATLNFSQIVRYRVNDRWSATGVYTTGLPLDRLLSKYSFSGTLALTRDQFTVWVRPGVHINVVSLAGLTSRTVSMGGSYRFVKR